MSASIVIPNWNGREKLERNLPAVFEVTGVYEVIVVDDGSTDDSVDFVKKNFPKVKLIVRGQNSGFSTTVNTGVKQAQGEFVFLLNTDARPAKDSLIAALKILKDPKVFSVSCNSGGSWSWARFNKGYFWHYMAEMSDKPHQTLWSSGGSGVFRTATWWELGGLDELFNRFYEEDVDLGYRATKRGYLNFWDPNSVVEHYKEKGVIEENFSKQVISRVAQRNQLLFIWKNIHDRGLLFEHKKALLGKLLLSPLYWRIFLGALARLLPLLKERKTEKAVARLQDRDILAKFQV